MYTNLYGSSFVAAKYCGLEEPPRIPKGLWQHGWVRGGIERPQQIFGTKIESLDTPCFVAVKWQEEFLKKHGYVNAKAIGLPSVYLGEVAMSPVPNSLLVMPQHSIPGMKLGIESQYAYAEYIASIKNNYDVCIACIGAYDFSQGFWKDAFGKYNIPVVAGADAALNNCLEEQNKKFAQFTHMTTNAFGSHVVYAAALGVKVSVSGPYEEIKKENIENIDFYRDNPDLISNVLERGSRDHLQKFYNWFFCEPKSAVECRDWGREEIGYQNKLLPFDMKQLFGWTPEIWIPSRIVTSAWIEHAPFTTWLIQIMKPKSIVELGTHYGYSYFSFCQTVNDLNIDTKCYCVDTWAGDDHAGLYADNIFNEIKKYNERYENFSQMIRATFDEANTNFANESIDLLHIDGFHSYEAVRHDFETWLPKMSKNGIILFHDINVHERGFGVWKFWEEIKNKYQYNLEFMNCHGLGCLFLSNPENILPGKILDIGSESKNRLQFLFQTAGETLSLHIENKKNETDLSKKILHFQECVKENAKYIIELNNSIESLKNSFSYRITLPLRIFRRLANYGIKNILNAISVYINISTAEYDEENYIHENGNKMGKLWIKFPKIHYSLFNNNSSENIN